MNATANGKQAWSLMVWKLECKTVKRPSNEEIPDGQRTGMVHVNRLRHRVQPKPQLTWWPTLDTACNKAGIQLASFATDEDLRS